MVGRGLEGAGSGGTVQRAEQEFCDSPEPEPGAHVALEAAAAAAIAWVAPVVAGGCPVPRTSPCSSCACRCAPQAATCRWSAPRGAWTCGWPSAKPSLCTWRPAAARCTALRPRTSSRSSSKGRCRGPLPACPAGSALAAAPRWCRSGLGHPRRLAWQRQTSSSSSSSRDRLGREHGMRPCRLLPMACGMHVPAAAALPLHYRQYWSREGRVPPSAGCCPRWSRPQAVAWRGRRRQRAPPLRSRRMLRQEEGRRGSGHVPQPGTSWTCCQASRRRCGWLGAAPGPTMAPPARPSSARHARCAPRPLTLPTAPGQRVRPPPTWLWRAGWLPVGLPLPVHGLAWHLAVQLSSCCTPPPPPSSAARMWPMLAPFVPRMLRRYILRSHPPPGSSLVGDGRCGACNYLPPFSTKSLAVACNYLPAITSSIFHKEPCSGMRSL